MLRRISTYITLISLLLFSIGPITAFAAPRSQRPAQRAKKKVAPEFEGAPDSSTTVRTLIQTKGSPSAAQDDAIRGAGGSKRASYSSLNTVVADVPLNQVASLAGRDDVEYVSPDRPVRTQANLTNDTTGATQVQSGLNGMPGFTGKGVTIAILDSGISANHPDLMKNNNQSRVIAAVDFTGSARTGDADGHGTGVAGVAAGNGAASDGYEANYAGLAPEASLVDVRVLDEHGVGRTSNVLAAINWVIENRARYDIRILNLSLGSPVRESFHVDPVCKAVERATLAGLVVVSSSGNQGRTDEIVGYNADGSPQYQLVFGAVNSPGHSPYVITVGATDSKGTTARSDDTVAAFSSKGPTRFDHLSKPDIVAPGRRIVAPMSQEPNSSLPTEYPDRVVQPESPGARTSAYFNYSGTSFAAPVIAGTVALMLEANGSLTPLLVKAVLTRTAQRLPAATSSGKAETLFSQGAGLVNVASAVSMARAVKPNADRLKAGDQIFKPGITLNSLAQSTSIGGESVEPSANVLYANGVVFANKPVLTNGIMISDGIMLMDGIMLADGVVIGSGIMISDGVLISNGFLLMDGILVGDGVALGDGILVGDGIVLGDKLVLSDGFMISDGILLGDGIYLSDGFLLMDGILVGDGILMSDGMTLGSGFLLMDGLLISDGHLYRDGIMLMDGILVGDGIVMSDGVASASGILMSDGILIGDGILLGDGITVASGYTPGSGYTLGSGILISDEVVLGDGLLISDGILLGDGIVLGGGIMLMD